MQYSRIIGYNIGIFMQKRNMSIEYFARKLNYSEIDVHRILEGRLLLSPNDLGDIVDVLGITNKQLLNEDRYLKDYIKYGGQDDTINGREKILDLIDMYISIVEAVHEI